MSTTTRVLQSDTIPVNLTVNNFDSGPVSGLTPKVAIRVSTTADRYLDFDDLTWKTSGWTQRQADLTEVEAGIYYLASSFSLDSTSNTPALPNTFTLEYEVTGTYAAKEIDNIRIDSDSETLAELLDCAKNRLEIDFTAQELVLYDDAGTSIIQRWPLSTDGGEDVSTQFGVQTKRGVPIL